MMKFYLVNKFGTYVFIGVLNEAVNALLNFKVSGYILDGNFNLIYNSLINLNSINSAN